MFRKPLSALVLGTMIFGFMALSTPAYADITTVPLPSNTEVRMQLDDKYPMVLSGFVKQDMSDVMDFYQSNLGEPLQVTEDINRYTYFYDYQGKKLRVSFYQQDMWCEISIMLSE